MHVFRNILVPIHGDPTKQAVLARACRLAKQNGARVKLIAIVEDLPWYTRLVLPTAEELQTLLVREISESLEGLAQGLRSEGIDSSVKVLTGRRHLEMVREVLRGEHDLLMKEAEPNESVLFGSIDMHLLRTCPCPMWLFKPEHAGRNFAQVLAAVDPAPPPDEGDLLHLKEEVAPKDAALDAKILDLAGSVADNEGAELHVVHAWSTPGVGLARGHMMLAQDQIDSYVEETRAEARKVLERLAGGPHERPGCRSLHLLRGEPADVIPQFAKTHGIDLIVMGTVARTGIPGLLIGNTAESILQRVDCSVLAVKPDGFVSPVEMYA